MTPPDDDQPTDEELREAEALARALERGVAPGGAPEDALQAAGLLRYAKHGAELGDEKAAAILADALARARPPSPRARKFRLFGWFGLALAGAFAALLVLREEARKAPLPAPPRALLEAQIDAASGRSTSLAALRAETDGYRRAVYASLENRYGR